MTDQQPTQQPAQQVPQQKKEDSFFTGMKGAMGVVFALFLLFVVLPCAFCGGTTMCAGIMGGASDYDQQMDDSQSSSSDDESGYE